MSTGFGEVAQFDIKAHMAAYSWMQLQFQWVHSLLMTFTCIACMLDTCLHTHKTIFKIKRYAALIDSSTNILICNIH